jgi:hypothetical protein
VSTDASLFPIYFFDCDIFCEKCAKIQKFRIFSQEKYDKNYSKHEIPPNRPLFCKCEECENSIIYATDEFAELYEDPTFGLCKIWGMGNLETGDQVFYPGKGSYSVDGIDRVYGSLPHIILKNQKGEKTEIEVEAPLDENGSGELYRLFPQDAENARIGDKIYNTKTKTVGEVIGLEFNGGQTLIVKSKDGKIAKCHCENNVNYLTDEILELNAKWRCRDLKFFPKLNLSSKSKVLSVNCVVPNFKSVCELDKIISSIPQVRCFLKHISVEKARVNSNDIYKELIKNCIYICCCYVKYENQEVNITGFHFTKDIQKKIHRALAKFPIKRIYFDIKMRPDLKIVKTINLSNCFIRISKMGKEVHIDGWVRNEKLKKRAKLYAFLRCFSFRIENHLLIMN